MVAKDIADRLFSTTPRTIIIVIVSILSAYVYIQTTYVTHEDLDAYKIGTYVSVSQRVDGLEQAFSYHVEDALLWQLKTRVQDLEDKRYDLSERMALPGGMTQDNKDRERELLRRQAEYQEQIDCIKAGGKHCLTNGDH